MPDLVPIPYPPPTRGRLVVWGLMHSAPFGGMFWQVLHYLAGFRRLGFDVWYVQDSDTPLRLPGSLSKSEHYGHDYEANLRLMVHHLERIGLADRWVFRPPGRTDVCLGARDLAGLRRLYREADAVFNLCGAQEPRPEHAAIRCLALVETDPVFNQVRAAAGDADVLADLDRYDVLFTYGENLGAADCRAPVGGYAWHTTRPPVVPEWWRTSRPPAADAAMTTVSQWKERRAHHKDVCWNGEVWRWSKRPGFRRLIDLPTRCVVPFELAVTGISDAGLCELHRNCWRTVHADALQEADAYRTYIRASRGEISAAKHQYVAPRSGWFSDRSVCYLSAGRPVVVEETGFSTYIPTGEGLFAFETVDEAAGAVEAVASDYARHACAAAELARAYFSTDRVLGDMLRTTGLL